MTSLCRRTVLLAPLGYLVACSQARWYRPAPLTGGVIRVPLSELDADGFIQVDLGKDAFMLQRGAGGELSAVTLTCSHQGCAVSKRRDELVCPCHGSRFDLRGAVLNGPATEPLTTYRVEVEGPTALVYLERA
ncbi:MAG TPA: Rieske (2Fe-2S) protein [Myxococcota bacterium]|nr:Rieske (2Fe-2S) protein [Myxococcota bacterium]